MWTIPTRGARFKLQLLRDRQEATRVVGEGMTDARQWRGMWFINTRAKKALVETKRAREHYMTGLL